MRPRELPAEDNIFDPEAVKLRVASMRPRELPAEDSIPADPLPASVWRLQ